MSLLSLDLGKDAYANSVEVLMGVRIAIECGIAKLGGLGEDLGHGSHKRDVD